MFWTKKAVSLGTIATLLLAGGVLLNGRPALASQEAQQAAKSPARAKTPVEAPFTEKELVKLIKHNKKNPKKVADEVEARGLDFEFTPQIEKKLKKAGAVEELIAYMKQFTPSARANRKARLSGPVVSPAEAAAYNKLKSEKDPGAMIKDAEDFAQKFPKSVLLTYVYAMEAGAYQEKDDAVNAVKYGEKSLNANPKNLISLLLVSEILPQPQMLNDVSDAEKEKRLVAAEGYAQQALKEIDQIPRKPKEADEAYQKRKGNIAAGAYASLGMIHLERSKMSLTGTDMSELAKAEQNYELAIAKSTTPDPADYFRLGEVYASEKKLSDAIDAFSKAGQLAPGTVIEQLANQEVATLKKQQKTQSKAAAKP